MCPQLDVSDKNDKKRKICPTKLDLSDKNDEKPTKNSLCFVGVFLKNANYTNSHTSSTCMHVAFIKYRM